MGETEVTKDEMYLLTRKHSFPLPIPPPLHNSGNFIVSLSEFVRWLGRRAEELGVEIYPGFAGSELVYNAEGDRVIGVATNDVGLDRRGNAKVKWVFYSSVVYTHIHLLFRVILSAESSYMESEVFY